ncbi:hypothetical protein FACS1894116_06070 [Betaproteobacteria bacterium]|nr:hypothetical protein FACS1894116_06070 [Betaproteobacteria bacterium]GHT98217.1 hypothetical protein FACS1894154_03140 [Betaproteobacteria bacterium]
MWKAGRLDEAVATYDEIERRFGNETSNRVLQYIVIRVLLDKGMVLDKQGYRKEAIAVYNEIERRFVDKVRDPNIMDVVDKARCNMGRHDCLRFVR